MLIGTKKILRGHGTALASLATLTALAVLTLCAVPRTSAAAEAWPTRPVRWVLSFGAPGGAPDLIARLTAPKLSEMWGKQVVIDLVAGRVQITFGSATSLPHIRAGRLNAIAVTTLKRSPAMPEIPTMDESGCPGFEAAAWYGLLAPAGTPPAIIAKLHRDFFTVLQQPDVREALGTNTIDTTPSPSPKHFSTFLAAETAKLSALVRETGARSD